MVWIYLILLIHSSADGHLGCFHHLIIMNNAAVNFLVQICVCMCFPISHGWNPRSEIAES